MPEADRWTITTSSSNTVNHLIFQCSFKYLFSRGNNKTKNGNQLSEKIPKWFVVADIIKNRLETADQTVECDVHSPFVNGDDAELPSSFVHSRTSFYYSVQQWLIIGYRQYKRWAHIIGLLLSVSRMSSNQSTLPYNTYTCMCHLTVYIYLNPPSHLASEEVVVVVGWCHWR